MKLSPTIPGTARNDAVEAVVITGLAVRGELGPVTVWAAPGARAWTEHREAPDKWICLYRGDVRPSFRTLRTLSFANTTLDDEDDHGPQRRRAPGGCVRLAPGQGVSFYVHSALRSDTGIVYDNQRHATTPTTTMGGGGGGGGPLARQYHHRAPSSPYVAVHPGCAHLSPRPFSGYHPWGAWRSRRQFVGKVHFQVRRLLWRPAAHASFPAPFRAMVRLLLSGRRSAESPLSSLPEDVFFYVIHLCKADCLRDCRDAWGVYDDDDPFFVASKQQHHPRLPPVIRRLLHIEDHNPQQQQQQSQQRRALPRDDNAAAASSTTTVAAHLIAGGVLLHLAAVLWGATETTATTTATTPGGADAGHHHHHSDPPDVPAPHHHHRWRCPLFATLAAPLRLLLGGTPAVAPHTT